MNRCLSTSRRVPSSRNGFLLVIVLAVLVLLSLASYEFADRAVAEREASAMAVRQAEARMAALSAMDVVLDAISNPEFSSALFAENEWLIEQAIDDEERIGFSVMPIDMVAGMMPEEPLDNIFGVVSESGKININALAELEDTLPEEDQREVLVQLPGMSESIADTILDFIDADGTPRTFGTESDSGDVVIRNRPLDSLDDLLVLPEVDSILLYGVDFNSNGQVDPNEELDSVDVTSGLASYITVYGRELNVNSLGEPRIDINQDNVDTLKNDLTGVLGEDVASFVAAFRESQSSSAQQNQRALGRLSRFFGPMNTGTANLTGEINALSDLIDATASDGALSSPLVSTDINRLMEFYDHVSTTDAESIAGRIDINSASVQTLIAIAGLEESTATAIADRNDWTHPVELLTSGLVDLITFRRIDPMLTTNGRVFSFSAIGYAADGPMVRIDAVVDASTSPPKILKQVDMTRVGIGRTLEMVRPSVAEAGE